MDTYENIVPGEQEAQQPVEPAVPAQDVPEQPVVQADAAPAQGYYNPQPQQPWSAPAWQAPAQRRPSPYANSPYIHQPVYRSEPVKPAKQPKAGKGKAWKAVLCAILALAVLAGCCAVTAIAVGSSWEARVSDLQKQYNDKLSDLESKLGSGGNTVVISGEVSQGTGYTPAQVYAMSVDGVVIINTKVSYTEYGQTSVGISTGSGFVISGDGYVVTNYHVVESGESITVGTNDGAEYAAELIGYDDTNDVALLKVQATGLHYLPLGDSDALIVGDQVAAVGNPLGELTSTLTVGYISAKERDVNTDGFAINMLQTDAAINSGNSGGPLLNMRGEVIGITTAKYSGTSSSGATIEGVGFAIPINDVVDLLSDLMTYGYVNSGYLGVTVSDMDPEAAAYYGMPRGARVEDVVAGYAAQRAGVQAKDIIIALGDYEIETVSELTRTLRKFAPGQTTTITVYRGGRELVLTITLDEKPTAAAGQTPHQGGSKGPTDDEWAYWYEYLKPFFDDSKGQTYDEWFKQFKEHFGQ